jgi:hypothetical protein
MDPIQPITARIPEIPGVERVTHRVDPEQQKRDQQRREQQRRREHERRDSDDPQEDDGLPHIDVSV